MPLFYEAIVTPAVGNKELTIVTSWPFLWEKNIART